MRQVGDIGRTGGLDLTTRAPEPAGGVAEHNVPGLGEPDRLGRVVEATC